MRVAERLGLAPITVHQPRYNLFDRRIEWDLLPHTERAGTGVIAYSLLAQGLLTDRYLRGGVPAGGRATFRGQAWLEQQLSAARLSTLQALDALAHERGQTLAQMALSWALRSPGVTSVLVGASTPEQLEQNVGALAHLSFTPEELERIDALSPATRGA
jgi:L-glyceraldehyde 3-phosphate reductase